MILLRATLRGNYGGLLLLLTLLSAFTPATTVKHENFKTCSQSGFCRRNRDFADKAAAAGSGWISPYELDDKSLSLEKGGRIVGTVHKTVKGHNEPVDLPLVI